MTLKVNMADLIAMVFIFLTLKLILTRWKPPLMESLQAIICCLFGALMGAFFNPTKEGIVVGLVTASITYYGGDLLNSFTDLRSELQNSDIKLEDKKKL